MPEATPAAPQKQRFEIPTFADLKVAPEAPAEVPATSTPATSEPAEGVKSDAQNTGEQAPPAKPEATPEDEKTQEQAAKREGRRFERRLDKAYRERAAAQARAAELEKRLQEVQQPKPQAGKPTLEQSDFDPEKYATAVANYEKSEDRKRYDAERQAESNKAAQAKLLAAWEEKADKGQDKYEDWQEKVGELQPANPLVMAIMEADNGEDIAHYLGSHPKEARRIAELSVVSQVREIGKLEMKLATQPEKPKAPSKAPPPIAPIAAGTQPPSTDLEENLTDKEWMARRYKKLGRR